VYFDWVCSCVGEGRGGCNELRLGCVCDDLDLHGRRGCRRGRGHPSVAVEQDSVVALYSRHEEVYVEGGWRRGGLLL
jgi:hypothetical protein